MAELIWPVYEFRPLPGEFRGEVRRYADGAWIPDDGEYDVAFIGDAESGEHWTYAACLYFQPPYHENIVCSWRDRDFAPAALHPRGNPWHYALRPDAKGWGKPWGWDNHANRRAGSEGMSKMAGERGRSSGRLIEFHADDKHIAAGLLRERDSKRVFAWPADLVCMYCGEDAPVVAALRGGSDAR